MTPSLLGAFNVTFASTNDAGSSIADRKAGTPFTARSTLRAICSAVRGTGLRASAKSGSIKTAKIKATCFIVLLLTFRGLSHQAPASHLSIHAETEDGL